MLRKTGLLAIVTGSFICASVFAADDGFYLYGAAGPSKIILKQGDIDASLGQNNVVSKVEEHDRGYKAQIGWMFNNYFGVEGGFVKLGKAKYSATYTGGSSTSETKIDGYSVAGVVVFPLSKAFSLIGKAGMFGSNVRVDTSNSAGVTSTATSDKWWPTAGFGAMLSITPQFAVRADYDRYSKQGDKKQTGDLQVDLWTLGLVYKFF